MATLTVNGVEVRVVGHHDVTLPGPDAVPCIKAAIVVPGHMLSSDLDGSSMHVLLTCDDGRTFEGNNLWRVGHRAMDGSGHTYVCYEGFDVHEV